ncbi:MAG: outer membrane lipoprotein-sorting protein [bacterium]
MKAWKALFTAVMFGFLVTARSGAVELTPKDILSRADEARGDVGGLEWEIKITSIEDGRTSTRNLKLKASDGKNLAEFIAPARVRGRKLLMIDRNMWFIKPGLRKPIPISPRQKLMGGAAYGDIASTRYAKDYEITSVSEEEVNGEACYIFDLSATNKKATYDSIRYWVSKERLVGVKSDFFTVSGKIFKSAAFQYENSITIDKQSRCFISKMVITDGVIKENVTTLSYDEISLKRVPDSTFDLNLLIK